MIHKKLMKRYLYEHGHHYVPGAGQRQIFKFLTSGPLNRFPKLSPLTQTKFSGLIKTLLFKCFHIPAFSEQYVIFIMFLSYRCLSPRRSVCILLTNWWINLGSSCAHCILWIRTILTNCFSNLKTVTVIALLQFLANSSSFFSTLKHFQEQCRN